MSFRQGVILPKSEPLKCPLRLGLTRLPILLAQVKAGNNSYKIKNEIRQILYLLHQHNKITKKKIIIRDPKTFCFNFDWPKYVDNNFKHEI